MQKSLTKILFQNRKKNWIGGDVIQMERTMEEVGKEYDVTFNDQPLFTPAILLSDYALVHLWNFSMAWTKYQVWAAKRQGLKIVCSMIYHDTEIFTSYEDQQTMIDNIDMCLFLCEGEVERARRHLTIPDEKIRIIPNGLDSWWFTLKARKYLEKGYVLTVGRLDGSKGQLETAIACKELGLKYICVGENLNENYADLCKQNGAFLLPPRPQKNLLPIYDNAAVFVLASMTELFPLTVMEAGARGLNSVVVQTCEWKDIPNVEWCEHGNAQSIKEAISKALLKPKNTQFQKKLRDMTWEDVGKSVLKVYNELL